MFGAIKKMFFCEQEREVQRQVQLKVLDEAPKRTRRNFKKVAPGTARVKPVVQYHKLPHAVKQRYDLYRCADNIDALLEQGITRKTIVRDFDKGYVAIVNKDQSS